MISRKPGRCRDVPLCAFRNRQLLTMLGGGRLKNTRSPTAVRNVGQDESVPGMPPSHLRPGAETRSHLRHGRERERPGQPETMANEQDGIGDPPSGNAQRRSWCGKRRAFPTALRDYLRAAPAWRRPPPSGLGTGHGYRGTPPGTRPSRREGSVVQPPVGPTASRPPGA